MADLNTKMNDQVPFAVVGSRDEVVVNGHKARARQYPWGTVEGMCVLRGGVSVDSSQITGSSVCTHSNF